MPASAAPVTCAEQVDPSACDSDRDRITDVVEIQVCGTSTCATGREDDDGDGIPDWSELLVCGGVTCADPRTDTDGDGIPDFAEIFVCGSVACSTGREDVDSDTFGDWVEFVICGDRTCANGTEDYDHDGISDAQQLAACIVAYDVTGPALWIRPPMSGYWSESGLRVEIVWWPLIVCAVVALLALLLLGLAVWFQRRRDDRPTDASDESDLDELLGLDR